MRPDVEFAVWTSERQQRIEGVLERILAAEVGPPGLLADAMRYAVLGGGKRMRPLLAYAAGEFSGAAVEAVDAAAASVELIHAYSLVHDDLPCMDDDTLRRGRPTTHIAFGEAMALLAGDALQALAFGVLARSALPQPAAGCALLAKAAGAIGMAGGQAIDLAETGSSLPLAALTNMHRLKTGALIGASVSLGAAAGGPQDPVARAALARYAAAAGLAFQVVDDVLDVEGTAATLGKTAGKDAQQGKTTFVTVMGLDAARAHAEALRQDAHAALAPFGARGTRLVELADWITQRRH
jgi:farnesyl diphosphate synthase